MPIETVVFDLDGVLCTLDHSARLAKLAAVTGRPAQTIHAAIWESGFEDDSDAGRFSADEYLRGFGERIGYPLCEAEWIAGRAAASKPIVETLSLAADLSARVRLALLTNNGHLLKRALGEFLPDIAALFGDHVFVSAEFGVCKPEPEVFLRVCERLGAEPRTTLMIDDRPENIEGARKAGLAGHVFRGPESLAQELLRIFPR